MSTTPAKPTSTLKKDSVMIGTHVQKVLHTRIRITAAQQGLSMSQWLQRCIDAGLQDQDTKNVS